ncbi:iron ABC transporter substrate-binding protein [Yonghaparkia sp. Root332]|uniref:iron ABC transporter substrate-binding protein n=1 Tax=Yonghaparkia sp. Root332 TaxID=1736516 RepID=UPI0006F7A47B|nr:iron ABC transporter substrate-binding protein [Yonghaparkia sp. Root332]KQV25984.1 iron ABC transporter substrate-binding protein [Yonghaparkia sp. Root332]
MRSSRPLALLALPVAGLLLAGCAATPAEEEAAFTLYSGRDEDLVQPLIDAFTEETGIQVDVRYGNTPEMAALLLEEGDATPADVFLSQDAGALGALSDAELFATLPDDITGAVTPEFSSTDGSWVGVTGRARVVVYDGERLSADELPDSIDGYVTDEWRGRLGVAPTNASFQSFITALRVIEGEDAAEQWAEALSNNDPQIFESNVPILTAVNDGALEAGLINHYYWFRQAAEVGADNMRAQLKFLTPGDAGSIVNVTGAGLLSGAAENEDARAFIEYLVSQAGQGYFVNETFEYPLVPGIEAAEGLPALESLVTPDFDLSDLDSLQQSQELLSRVGLI